MDWNNLLTLAGVFIGAAVAAYVGYSKRWPAKPDGPVLTAIGVELGNREQTERLIGFVARCATALEVLADRRTEELSDMHQELLDRLDKAEQHARRRQPARRR
ncbi:hypothetical protein [Mesorhizobium sp.]|uniref:hypothetical protein n=1 Tax=Mesorhizobium sp. TaxID=1871066 RepID=UPI000FE71805|nr:hypothetical protein [Mesorhizobium sp.]RWF66827.1 MAG: hypothetical protein EOS47_04365 [Mesorhizobium sp.]